MRLKKQIYFLIGMLQPIGMGLVSVYIGWNSLEKSIINLILIIGFGFVPYWVVVEMIKEEMEK